MGWKLADAKNRFSEVFRLAITDGPQHITRRGEEAVLLSRADYDRLASHSAKPKMNFLELLRSGPSLEGVDLTRDKSVARGADFEIE